MRAAVLLLLTGKTKLIIIGLLILPFLYYAFRTGENYLYLQKHFFNANVKYTGSSTLSGKIFLQNTASLKVDTVNLSHSDLILNFSATWCKPCLEEVPLITKIHDNQKIYHYKFYCILEEQNQVINSFSKKNKLAFETYKIISGKPDQLTIHLFPTTIVCRYGKSNLKIEGQLSQADATLVYKSFTDHPAIE